MLDQLPGLFVHNLQLQKSPSRFFGQNTAKMEMSELDCDGSELLTGPTFEDGR